MKKIASLLLLSLYVLSAAAQGEAYRTFGGKDNSDIEIRANIYGEGMEREVVLSAISKVPGSYTLALEYCHEMPGRGFFAVIRGQGLVELERFKTVIPDFNFSYCRGVVNDRRLNENFTYRLPYAEGKSKNVSIRRYDDSKKEGRFVNRYSYSFDAEEGDDIYAMRKGVVYDIDYASWYIEGLANNQTLRKANKSVFVEHPDGSVAIYHNVLEETLCVKPGDLVFPDDVIGKAGTLNEVAYEIMVSIYYLKCPMIRNIPDFRQLEYNYIEPFFSTPSGKVRLEANTIAVCNAGDDLITAEMTKREKKNRKKR